MPALASCDALFYIWTVSAADMRWINWWLCLNYVGTQRRSVQETPLVTRLLSVRLLYV